MFPLSCPDLSALSIWLFLSLIAHWEDGKDEVEEKKEKKVIIVAGEKREDPRRHHRVNMADVVTAVRREDLTHDGRGEERRGEIF